MKLISVNLPESYIKVLELLVTEAKFPNRSEAIRVAIRDLIKTEYLTLSVFVDLFGLIKSICFKKM